MKMTSDKFLDNAFPEHLLFRHKLRRFCEDYSLGSKPALIWQCHPSQPLDLDVTDKALQNALGGGAPSNAGDGWWHGFQSGRRPAPVFDGLAAYSASDDQGWMTEIHTDGHIIAGLWNFPEFQSPEGAMSSLISDFHAKAFEDFGSFARSMSALSPNAYPYEVTCALVNSHQISYRRERHPYGTKHVAREFLEWRVRAAENAERIDAVLSLMGDELLRGFGQWANAK